MLLGPGNNGLDGLVTARYLAQLDYLKVQVFTFKNDKLEECHRLFLNLAKNFGVQVIEMNEAEQRAEISKMMHEASFVVDAIFGNQIEYFLQLVYIYFIGFGFHDGAIKCPYDVFISSMVNCRRPIVSIDVPSGWKIDAGKEEIMPFLSTFTLLLIRGTRSHIVHTFHGRFFNASSKLIYIFFNYFVYTEQKICMKSFKGIHYIGGAFIPK